MGGGARYRDEADDQRRQKYDNATIVLECHLGLAEKKGEPIAQGLR
jgi:hypothetical protein